jgi:hypothetical protein
VTTKFEEMCRWAISMSGASYTQLGREAHVNPHQIGKFMREEITLSATSLGKLLDVLGCKITPPTRLFVKRPTGRPPKDKAIQEPKP